MSKKNSNNSTGKAIASAIARITYRDIKQEQDRYKAQPDEDYQPLFKKYPLGGRY